MKQISNKDSQSGSAIVIALLVLALLMVFVAFAVSRTTSETIATGNEASETRAFTAAEASLENMTQQFDSIFDFQLSPTPADLTNIRQSEPPGFEPCFNFNRNQIEQIGQAQQVVIDNGPLEGLYSTRDTWRLDTTAIDTCSQAEVNLKRDFYNDRVPIFQFGIFYEDDLEFHPGPQFNFGGRVHANGNLFLAAGTGLYFDSKVTANGQIVTDIARNGVSYSQWGDNVNVYDGTGYRRLYYNMGSALASPVNGANAMVNRPGEPPLPVAYPNASWNTNSASFNNNLLAEQRRLNLPIKLAGNQNVDYVQLIRRSLSVGDLYKNTAGNIVPVDSANADNQIVASSRYANKDGLRVSLADSKERLPGCADPVSGNPVATVCGVRLDGDAYGGIDRDNANAPISTGVNAGRPGLGYQPRPLRNGTQATRINGNRFAVPGRQVWIKVELASVDPNTQQPVTFDVTEDILSLGVTEKAPQITNSGVDLFAINDLNYYNNAIDSRSIIRLQRFHMPGVPILNAIPTDYLSSRNWNGMDYNYVQTNWAPALTPAMPPPAVGSNERNANIGDETFHKKPAIISDATTQVKWIVPFPIKMFDTREGVHNDDIAANTYGTNYVPSNGVMSIVEIDVGNLREFLAGNYNNLMPIGTVYGTLSAANVPNKNGWVMYVSDRRGDVDFDGEYDMENVYINDRNPLNAANYTLQDGEDVNKDGALDADYYDPVFNTDGEASGFWITALATYAREPADKAAVVDHMYYRRGVRLVNGERIPGRYDSAQPLNTQGFTFASENGVYVQGNYNARDIDTSPTGCNILPTPPRCYRPQNTVDHIPASIVGDAVMILSNGWQDSRSFRYPFDFNNRRAEDTYIRFAMISGDAISSLKVGAADGGVPNQGGGDHRMTGGVHNFKRFLENWGGRRLNYVGSLINIYNAHNNNGAFKCCVKVYSPPQRNWTFDISFRDATRLPPATPFFQVISLTGFQRVNQ